tara:strand:- start:3089 stop:3811 length:723 start_codon:yes stop_codon:yes gene_type:complete
MKNVINPARVQSLLNPVQDLYAVLESMDLVMDFKDGRYIHTERNDNISYIVDGKIGHASVQMAAFFRLRMSVLDNLSELADGDLDDDCIKWYNEDLIEELCELSGLVIRVRSWSKIEIPETVEAAPEAAPEAAVEAAPEAAKQQQNKGAATKTYKYTLTKAGAERIITDMNGLNGWRGGADAHIKTIQRFNVKRPKSTVKRYCVFLKDGTKIYSLKDWKRVFNPTHAGMVAHLHDLLDNQ